MISTFIDPGISFFRLARVLRTVAERATVFAPPALEIATTTTPPSMGSSGFPEYITFMLSFSRESTALPTSLMYTGAPSIYFMMRSSYSFPVKSCPSGCME